MRVRNVKIEEEGSFSEGVSIENRGVERENVFA